jgi:solute carrier family 8 (sodium/calcium exchanger)
MENLNPLIGFKCLHYSVTESNGTVAVTIEKKKSDAELTFGVRTVKGTATESKDYYDYDQKHSMKARDTELKVEIKIIDNNEWEPDMDFYIEIYDIEKEDQPRLSGEDTRTTVTILDEDFPGTLGFKVTNIRVQKEQDKVEIVLVRTNGSDGAISCMIKTMPYI